MNTTKIQKEIFQQLLSSCLVQYVKEEDCIYVTTDGIRAFRVDVKRFASTWKNALRFQKLLVILQ